MVLVDSEATTKLINAMLDFWSSALSSRRIHIGMDETHDLGRGRFLDLNGYERGFDIFNRHLARVNELCCKHNLKPMIWSDMYFRLSNPQQNYYGTSHPVPDDVKAAIPRNVQLVYWDYYHFNVEDYTRMIRAHRELGIDPLMGSGIWTSRRPWYDHGKTMRTVVPCLQACRQEKITELFFTMWGDDGAYCNYDSALAGIVSCADLAFGVEDESRTAARFAAVCMADYQAVVAASEMNALILSEEHAPLEVIASHLIWDDPLLGIVFDDYKRRNPEFDLRLLDLYDEILNRIRPGVGGKCAGDFEHAVNIMQLISLKLELRGALEAAYDLGDRVALRDIATTLIPATIAADATPRSPPGSRKPECASVNTLRGRSMPSRNWKQDCRCRRRSTGSIFTATIPAAPASIDPGEIRIQPSGTGTVPPQTRGCLILKQSKTASAAGRRFFHELTSLEPSMK